MSTLGELLRLLHDADRGVETFAAEFRDWSQPAPSTTVVLGRRDEDFKDRSSRLRAVGGDLFPPSQESLRRIWFRAPDQVRVEVVQSGQLMRCGVRDRARWWRWDREGGATSGRDSEHDRAAPLPPLLSPTLLSPAGLIGRLWFEPGEDGLRVGRAVVTARARLRAASVGSFAREFEFEFDAEHGIMLRRAVFEAGQCVQITEALGARFGMPLEPQLFVFAPQWQEAPP